MTKKVFRKCGSRSISGKRWGVEFPLDLVERLKLKNSTLEITENKNIITIRKVDESIVPVNSKVKPTTIIPSEPVNEEEESIVERLLRTGKEGKDYDIH